ncbi:metallophosphoesterase family protein [Chromatocurvus halotolerans]|uniref:3',5'-cyclic AMP phosphodiesterase CpdA n=1 Tax=Chromatocurvus halotolerans TaxID=1132028 RepID=A0A4R2KTU8_9GAMM|nr:metallophosphoesterase [Chromatocurvus halotolerans]TCO76282.1 3',5'-cyclic AMP phosphodiesterase CpdA [Chromatocurvus halotolerans]
MTGGDEVAFVHFSDPHLTALPPLWGQVPSGPDPENRMKRRLSHLSWQRKRRFEHRHEVLALLVAHIRQASPAQILLTGDLTHIGQEDEFREAAQWLRSVASPRDLALVPGNHDATASDSRRFQREHWADYLRGDDGSDSWPSLRVRQGVAFIGLDSAVVTPPLLAAGRVGDSQRQRLGQLLEDCRAQGLFRVVYLHHCPLPGLEKWRKRLVDAGQLRDTLTQAGVELVLHGHGHRYHQHDLQTATGTARVIAAPSASARGLHGKDVAACNAFSLGNTADGARELRLTRWGLNAGENAVEVIEETSWRYPLTTPAPDPDPQ